MIASAGLVEPPRVPSAKLSATEKTAVSDTIVVIVAAAPATANGADGPDDESSGFYG